MNKNNICAAALLAVVWAILREDFSLATLAVGTVIGAACVFARVRFLPSDEKIDVSYFWFAVYFFYLIGRIYAAGFAAIKTVFTGARVETVELKTKLTDKFLRAVLVNSITLVPGSASVDLDGDAITVLWLVAKSAGREHIDGAGEIIMGGLERVLLRAQRRA